MRTPNRIVAALAAVCVVTYFFVLAGYRLFAYFSPDDLMNLYGYWTKPVGDLIKANVLFSLLRPMGGVFYRTVYALAGFQSMPFRIACDSRC